MTSLQASPFDSFSAGSVQAPPGLASFPSAEMRGAVERYLAKRVSDEGLREDIAQETLIRAYRFLPTLSSPESLRPWLFRIARNQAATTLRREARRRETAWDFASDGASDLAEDSGDSSFSGKFLASGRPPDSPRRAAERAELLADLRAAMTELPERQRMAFQLFAVESRSLAEVADGMGCTAGAVKFHVHAARQKLRERLKGHLE